MRQSLRTIIILTLNNQGLSRIYHGNVTVLTKFVRHGCLTIVGFTNTILIFSNFKITFFTSLWVSELTSNSNFKNKTNLQYFLFLQILLILREKLSLPIEKSNKPVCDAVILRFEWSNPRMLSLTFVVGWDELLAEKRNVALISFSIE